MTAVGGGGGRRHWRQVPCFRLAEARQGQEEKETSRLSGAVGRPALGSVVGSRGGDGRPATGEEGAATQGGRL